LVSKKPIWPLMNFQIDVKRWYYCHPLMNGREVASNRNILPKAVKDFFRDQFFCCYEYEELSLDTEETMFQLVQRGIALTPAEKMRAMSTEWAAFAKQYEDDYILIVNLSKQNRASGFRLVLTIFTMIQEVMAKNKKKRPNNKDAPTLQASPQALLRVLDSQGDINPVLKLKLKAIFDRYEGLVKLCSVQVTATKFKVKMNTVFDPNPRFLRDSGVNHVRTFSPLELVVTAVLVAVHMDHRTDEQLLDDVKAMRLYLRVEHKDLRVNAQCWATAWFFITEIMDRRRGIKPITSPSADVSMRELRQSIERGTGSSTGLSLADGTSSLSDRDSSPLSSVPSSSSEDDSSDEDTSPPSTDDEDVHARPTRRALGKRPAKPTKRPAKRRRPSKQVIKRRRPAKKAKRTPDLDIRFEQLYES